jgi:hypothetical protein
MKYKFGKRSKWDEYKERKRKESNFVAHVTMNDVSISLTLPLNAFFLNNKHSRVPEKKAHKK